MKRRISYLLFFLPLIALAACGQSPDERLQAEMKTVSSWTATAQMAGEAWTKGFVPDAYARRTLETARENLRETAETLEQVKQIPANQNLQAQTEIGNLRQTMNQMRAAIESGNKSALAQSLNQLIMQKQALEMSVKSADTEQ